MLRLTSTESSDQHRRRIRFHMARCKGAGPLHDKLHAEASVAYVSLRNAQRAREDAEDDAVAAAGVAQCAEHEVEDALRDIAAAAQRLDRADASLAAAKTIFPRALTPEIKPSGEAQLEVLPALRVRLAAFKDDEEMGKAIARLDKAEVGLRAALDAEKAASAAIDQCFAIEREARRAVREQLESANARLRDLYKSSPALAERYFLRTSMVKKRSAPKPSDTPDVKH
jgi:hypothetical protein